jgi:Tfp pilus assembly protein PilE
MFKKKENGFSLVELAVAAAIATALAVVAVTVVSGTAASVSAKGSSAASVESCTISESLAKSGGDSAPTNCVAANSGAITLYSVVAGDASAGTGTSVLSLWDDMISFFGITDAQALAVIKAVVTDKATTITAGSRTYTVGPNATVEYIYGNQPSSFYGGYPIWIQGITATSGQTQWFNKGDTVPPVIFTK